MALTKITLRNFKSIGEEAQTIELAPYTLLFGPNSAGKSTLIQSLIYVHELMTKGTRDIHETELGGEAIDLGGFLQTVHGQNADRDITLELECELSREDLNYWDEASHSWRENVPWPYFCDSFELRPTGDIKSAFIKLEIGIASPDDPRIIVKRFVSGLNGVALAEIEATSAGKQVAVMCRSVRELYGQYDGESIEIPDSSDWEFKRTDWWVETDPEIIEGFEKYAETDPDGVEAEALTPWSLDQRDALPSVESSGACLLMQGFDDIERYFDEEEWFEGKGLNELRLVEAITVRPLEAVLKALKQLLYIGPLREIPSRSRLAGAAEAEAAWWNGSRAWEFGSGHNFNPGSSEEQMNEWLGNGGLKTGYQVRTRTVSEIPEDHFIWRLNADDLEDGQFETAIADLRRMPSRTRVFLEDESGELELSAKDVGAGISQIFPVLAASAIDFYGLLAIEQPELHVHPALQTELADVFIKSHFKNHNKFLLETHSEHLVLRFLRRIEETHANPDSKYFEADRLTGNFTGEDGREFYMEGVPTGEGKHPGVTNNDLVIYYVEPDKTGAVFHKIEISPDGDMAPWPNGFFTEREEELFG